MSKTDSQPEKKVDRIRRLSTLAAIRREIVRTYLELKEAGPAAETQYYRALCFLLTAAADVLKAEKTVELDKRLAALEDAVKAIRGDRSPRRIA